MEKELENYGFKIYKIGNVTKPTNVIPESGSANYIDGTTVDNSTAAPTTDVVAYIYDGKTDASKIDQKKMTIYKYTLKFQSNGTVVSAISDGQVKDISSIN